MGQMTIISIIKSPSESRYFDDYNEIFDEVKLLLKTQYIENRSIIMK